MNKEELMLETKVHALRFAMERSRTNQVDNTGLVQNKNTDVSSIINEAFEFYDFLTIPEQSKAEYTIGDLVSFGNYMVSDKRRSIFISTQIKGGLSLVERLGMVHQSDTENWKEWRAKTQTP